MPGVPQDYELVAIDSVVPHPDNPRRGDVDAIAASIRANGFYGSLIVQASSRRILAGEHRWRGAREVGLEAVPALVVDVDDEVARRILLVDNRSSDLARWDEPALVALLEELPSLEGTGFSLADLAELRPPEARTPLDEAPALPLAGQTICARGDEWVLGEHRLIVGDAQRPDVLEALLGAELVDLVWTDPPYGVDYVGGTAAHLTLEGDPVDLAATARLLRHALSNALAVCRPGAAWYVAGPDGPPRCAFDEVLTELGVWRQTLVWAKDSMVLGRSDFHYQHEVIFYGAADEDGPPALPLEPVDPGLYVGADEHISFGWAPGAAHVRPPDRRQTTVWYCARPRANREHPTMKPVELIRRAIENSSLPGAVVLDCFAGSGSTAIACHHARRRARLVELSPRYADVICRRYQMHTGIVPVRGGVPVDFELEVATADG